MLSLPTALYIMAALLKHFGNHIPVAELIYQIESAWDGLPQHASLPHTVCGVHRRWLYYPIAEHILDIGGISSIDATPAGRSASVPVGPQDSCRHSAKAKRPNSGHGTPRCHTGRGSALQIFAEVGSTEVA